MEGPHAVTDPSPLRAANARVVDEIETTFAKPVGELAPPFTAPQATTDPSAFSAAKAVSVDAIKTTLVKPEGTPFGTPLPHTDTVPSAFSAANALFMDAMDTTRVLEDVGAVTSDGAPVPPFPP